MYAIVFTKMITWILIISVYIQGTACYSRYTDLNHGTLLQKTVKTPEKVRALYTTLSPPTTSRPRKLSVYDTIRAAVAADKRLNGQNWYHQAIVSPTIQSPKQVFPTRETKRYRVKSSPKRISQGSSSSRQYKQVNTRPTSSTRFSNVKADRKYQNDRSTVQTGAISNLGSRNRARARARTSLARRSHSVGDNGLQQEAGMYDATATSNNHLTTGHFDVYEGGAIALYAVDHGHETTSNTRIDRTSDILEANSPKESRFKVLPNGSIVAYGVSTQEYHKHRKVTQAQPTKSTFRAADPRTQSSTAYARKQTRPTAASQRVSSSHYQAPLNVQQHQVPHVISASNQILLPAAKQVSPTRSSIRTTHAQPIQRWSPGGGVPVFDDSLSVVLDDQRLRQDDRYNSILGGVPEKGVLDYFPVEATKMSLRQTSTARRTTRLLPITTTTKPTTTTTNATTTTTTATTTTTTTTTTPKPKPKDDYWIKQGGVPINISIVNDNHVCPKSRARWQDYTVYLETKPRLCMIQITFNARYKREPKYHNTWWGNNVEWIYRTVYDPEVRIVDLHGWGGSTWYG